MTAGGSMTGSLDGPYEELYRRALQCVTIPDRGPIDRLRADLARAAAELVKAEVGEPQRFLDRFHEHLHFGGDLNALRMKLIGYLNATPAYRRAICDAFGPVIDTLVGPDIAIQKRINLTIQVPRMKEDIQHIHSDVEGGDSPFEVTLWIPLVDVYDTKSMYVLDRTVAQSVAGALDRYQPRDLQDLEDQLVRPEHYVRLKYGEALLFSPFLCHGNSLNTTEETRWSLNFRVKTIFSPYGAKGFGEYFEPLRLSPLTRLGLEHVRDEAR